jgi:hypothetical protein
LAVLRHHQICHDLHSRHIPESVFSLPPFGAATAAAGTATMHRREPHIPVRLHVVAKEERLGDEKWLVWLIFGSGYKGVLGLWVGLLAQSLT